MLSDDLLAARLFSQNKEFFASFSGAVTRSDPSLGNPYLDLGGSFAFFGGEDSLLTQGAGEFTAEHLDAIADFYRGRAMTWEAVVTPPAGIAALQRVLDRGAQPQGWESTMFRAASEPVPSVSLAPQIEVIEVGASHMSLWSAVGGRAFFGENLSDSAKRLVRQSECDENMRRYLALWEGQPAAAASITPAGESRVAMLGWMATLTDFRGRGLQTALLVRRMADARDGADFLVLGAPPNSSSQRNAERVGFRMAYTQLSLRVPVR